MMQLLTTAADEVNSWHTLLALLIVAFVLLAVYFVRSLFGKGGQAEEITAPTTAPRAAAPAPRAAAPAEDEQLVAVITAAVAAAMAEENGGTAPAFRVVSFRRI